MEGKKWEEKRGMILNNKPLNSSEVLFDHSSTVQYSVAIQGQAWTRSATSFGCTLPAIQPSRTAYSQETKARKWKKLKTSPLTEKKKVMIKH